MPTNDFEFTVPDLYNVRLVARRYKHNQMHISFFEDVDLDSYAIIKRSMQSTLLILLHTKYADLQKYWTTQGFSFILYAISYKRKPMQNSQ